MTQTPIKQMKYEWEKHENKTCADWYLMLFSAEKEKSKDLPFLEKVGDVALHNLEISLFPAKPYERPYKTEKQSEDKETVTLKKIFLDSYDGKVDSKFVLGYCDWMDWEFRTSAYFLDGKFKTGLVIPTQRHTQNLEEFKVGLTDYFNKLEKLGLPKFGDYLGNLFKNSNLPLEYIDTFRDLI